MQKNELDHALINATMINDDVTMSHLLDSGANPNVCSEKHGVPVLTLACRDDRNAAIIEKLIDEGANIDAVEPECGRTALMVAARDGHYSIVETLLMKGAKVNIKDRYGYTALIFASKEDHLQIIESLITKGVNINSRDIHGKTAFSYADERGYYRAKLLLMNAGGKP